MLYAVIILLLYVSLRKRGFAAPGNLRFRVVNALIATYLVVGNCWALQAFWYLFRDPAFFSETTHVFNNRMPSFVFYVNVGAIATGVVAVFVGFSLAYRKRRGIRRINKLLPILAICNVTKFMIGAFRGEHAVHIGRFVMILVVALVVIGFINYSIYRFYKNNDDETLFSE